MRAILVFPLAALAAAALAGPPALSDPFDVSGCGETDWVGAQMGDPNSAFTGLYDCHGLCRLAEFECRKLSQQSFNCQRTILGKREVWGKANCRATIPDDPPAQRECKRAAHVQAGLDKQAVKSALRAANAACGEWSTTCQNTCQGS